MAQHIEEARPLNWTSYGALVDALKRLFRQNSFGSASRSTQTARAALRTAGVGDPAGASARYSGLDFDGTRAAVLRQISDDGIGQLARIGGWADGTQTF